LVDLAETGPIVSAMVRIAEISGGNPFYAP
jgi:hypothetical protein